MQPAVVAKWSKWLMWFTPIIKLVDPGSNPAWGIHKQYMNGFNTYLYYKTCTQTSPVTQTTNPTTT